ncbi:pyrroloquinoline quinone (PQQ) biosynthesis protein C [Crossiella equi]|uniref:Pyrroloquinoline quinone (PQQ) biosynthesis protein C n=1 Tax=Crossiella equi TaxID=130796 RepID=A0ABS5A7C9_9PSEU|nr:transcriptional regulator [Crossiella equi]MBP2472499.1 pyrroloquinoline quinone (PQQ) biosynthesis protein C [Crossiella equi]
MVSTAQQTLAELREALGHAEGENRLVPRIAEGAAPVSVLAAFAGEQYRVISSDWRSLLHLAARAEAPAAKQYFSTLAAGEGIALERVVHLAEAAGMDEAALREYQPMPGCQAYPAYQAWLALNGDITSVILALNVNFGAWGEYCGRVSAGLGDHYGFDERGRGFFDFFAEPAPQLLELALEAVQAGLERGESTHAAAGYGRLLQAYELSFWNTLDGLG